MHSIYYNKKIKGKFRISGKNISKTLIWYEVHNGIFSSHTLKQTRMNANKKKNKE